MSGTLLIAFNGTTETGQFMGDQICSIKAAYMFFEQVKPDRVLLAVSPSNEMHFLWLKFIETTQADVVYDNFHPGNMEHRFEAWTRWRNERVIDGRRFDVYRELYRRIDGAQRQNQLCGGEKGLGRRNIFEYFYFGQEDAPEPSPGGDWFDDSLIWHPNHPADRGVFLAPYAKCQGNSTFTFDYWTAVVHKLIEAGVSVTVNHNGPFCETLNNHPLYRKVYPPFKGIFDEIKRHKIVTCGNTGIGWMAFACGAPVIAHQPFNSNMPDYRYELCGCRSLVEIIETHGPEEKPDPTYCARRLVEEVNRVTVLTTGCFDVIHAGHIRHLEESRALGTRLIVALNSDSSVKKLKGEGRPVNKQNDRAAVLQAIRHVDEVRVFDGDDALALIKEVKPDVLTNGCDHKLDEIVGKEFVEGRGGKVVITGGERGQTTTKIVNFVAKQADVLKACADAGAVSVNPHGKLRLLATEFLSVCNLPGDAADLGAYRGGTSLIMRRLAPNKDLHLFDTWEGNPHDDELCHHKKGEWKADLAECKRLVGEDERTRYYQGVFPPDGFMKPLVPFCFVYVDMDTYQSTRDAIRFFWPRLVQGGKMFFDDYAWEPCAGVKKAVDEAFADGQRVLFPALNTCVVTKQ